MKHTKRLFRSGLPIVMGILMLISPPMTAFAATKNEFYNEINNTFYDESGTGIFECGTTAAGATVSDSGDHVLDAFRYLTTQLDANGKPLADFMVAGIIGNLQQESGPKLDSGAQEDNSNGAKPINGVGFGIAQWSFTSRQSKLVAFIDAYNKDNNSKRAYTDFGLQLAYLYKEFKDDYKTLKAVTETTNEVDAAIAFHDGFEGSNDSAAAVIKVRGGNATRELQKYRSSSGSTAVNNTANGAATGTTNATAACNDDQGGNTDSGSYAAKIDGKCTQAHVQITGENTIPGKKVKPDVQLVVQCVDGYFPNYVKPYGTYPGAGGHGAGVAVDLLIPDYKTDAGRQKGWAIAKWLQKKHSELGIHYLIFAEKIWNIERDKEGWRPYNPLAAASSANDSSRHLNHVHVETWGNDAKGLN